MANHNELSDYDRAAPYRYAPQEFTTELESAVKPCCRCFVWGANGWEVLGYVRLPGPEPKVGDTLVIGEQFMAQAGTYGVIYTANRFEAFGFVLDLLLERQP